jgi:hypothetical protein
VIRDPVKNVAGLLMHANHPVHLTQSKSVLGTRKTTSPHPTHIYTAMGLRSYVKQLNYSYEVTTGLYMLEPWEKAVFSTFVVEQDEQQDRGSSLALDEGSNEQIHRIDSPIQMVAQVFV